VLESGRTDDTNRNWDGSSSGSADDSVGCIEREMRKRVWWACFVVDRTLSMKLGRLSSTNAVEGIKLELPLSVDDQYITDDSIHS
jgi:hypothetical protein